MQKTLKKAALASTVAAALLGMQATASALTLGAIKVHSALGEPLRAEIEVPQISSEEAASFKVNLGSAGTFQSAGVEFNPALVGTKVSLKRRANGGSYLRLDGNRPVNEPTLGIVIEADWADSSVVRDYTVLLDPPGRTASPVITQVAPQITTSPSQASAPDPEAGGATVAQQLREAARQQTLAEEKAAAAAKKPASKRKAVAKTQRKAQTTPARQRVTAAANNSGRVRVNRGNTASGIASSYLPRGVSLDQMMIAMLRANPNAFIRGNVNLVKAGAVLQMPTVDQAQAVSRAEARQQVVAQTEDFLGYRRTLASNAAAPKAPDSSAHSSSGKVQATVTDKNSSDASPDQLTLSKSDSSDQSATQVAAAREQQAQKARQIELDRTIDELKQIQSDSEASTTSGATSSDAPGLDVAMASLAKSDAKTAATSDAETQPGQTDAMTATDATDSDAAESNTQTSESDTTQDDVAAPPAAPVAPVAEETTVPAPVAPIADQPSFWRSLLENPLLLAALAGLAALLAALGIYRSRQRKTTLGSLDDDYDHSLQQSDSFFDASGGQRVDTDESSADEHRSSSMIYSPSQLDAAGDVDPLAEADVYLAYNRDQQAEDILKEALLTRPDHLGIQAKLAEIYAKRGDREAFEGIATKIRQITQGKGPQWHEVAALGAGIDASNALYQSASRPASNAISASTRAPHKAPTPVPAPALDRNLSEFGPETTTLDLNLDDLAQPSGSISLEDFETANTTPDPELRESTSALDMPELPSLDLSDGDTVPPATSTTPTDRIDLQFEPPSELPKSPSTDDTGSAALTTGSHSIDFDLDALSAPSTTIDDELDTIPSEELDDDHLTTKLALAQEFRTIGDIDGARSMAREVVAQATGSLKSRAEHFLSEL